MLEKTVPFVKKLKLKAGIPLEIQNIFDVVLFSSVYSILFGDELDQTDPKLIEAVHATSSSILKFHPFVGLTVFVPWLKHFIPGRLTGAHVFGNLAKVTGAYVQSIFDKHKQHYVEDEPRDVVDAYMDKVRTTTDDSSSFHPTNCHILHSLTEFVLGSFIGATPVLKWTCTYLIHYPEVQQKVQRSIDEVVGPNRTPTLADRQNLGYLQAVLEEVSRHSSTLGIGFPRSAMEDVEFHGYQIPKGTIVLPNYYSVHHDEAIWGDPQNFRPERFLETDGNFGGGQNVFSFGVGQRACIGESIGTNFLFLFLANILQTFTLKAAGKLPGLEPVVGFGLLPQNYDILFVDRNKDQERLK